VITLARDLIKKWEGCKLKAYLDGGGVPTIGYGHIKGIQLGDTCTQAQADAWLDEENVTLTDELNEIIQIA